jgi:hypothetical protein
VRIITQYDDLKISNTSDNHYGWIGSGNPFPELIRKKVKMMCSSFVAKSGKDNIIVCKYKLLEYDYDETWSDILSDLLDGENCMICQPTSSNNPNSVSLCTVKSKNIKVFSISLTIRIRSSISCQMWMLFYWEISTWKCRLRVVKRAYTVTEHSRCVRHLLPNLEKITLSFVNTNCLSMIMMRHGAKPVSGID